MDNLGDGNQAYWLESSDGGQSCTFPKNISVETLAPKAYVNISDYYQYIYSLNPDFDV